MYTCALCGVEIAHTDRLVMTVTGDRLPMIRTVRRQQVLLTICTICYDFVDDRQCKQMAALV